MKIFIICITFFSTLTSVAAELKVEPVYSIETTRREYPEPASQITRTYLGVSALYGVPLLAAELEVAQSTYTDSFPSDDSEVTSTVRRGMLGVRSYPITSKYFGFFIRAGVRAKQETLDIKESGVKTEKELPTYIDPYAGAGFSIGLSNNFALNAGATLVQNSSADVDSEDQYDVQYTLSASVRFGNR